MNPVMTFENDYVKVSVEVKGGEGGILIDEFGDMCKQVALAAGWHPNNVSDLFVGDEEGSQE